jgi:hypothetical protein
MNQPSDRERIAKLETTQEHQEGKIEDVVDRLDSLDAKVGKILETMQSHAGFFQGVIFTFSIIGALIGAVIGAFSGDIWKRIVGS